MTIPLKDWDEDIRLVTRAIASLEKPSTAVTIASIAYGLPESECRAKGKLVGRMLRVLEEENVIERTTLDAPHLWRLKEMGDASPG